MVLLLKFIQVGLVAAALPKDLKLTDPASVQGVAKAIAADAMSYYKGTVSQYVDLAPPYWWWQMGALSGAMLDYSHYTGDKSYDDKIATALLAQVGPEFNFMSPQHVGQLGNDDLGFWGFAVMSAAERNFPQPPSKVPSWLKMSENIFNSLASRWDTTSCGGGLPWQIYKENANGINYKNSVSNAAFFQLAARLARATGNQTYVQWANKVYDWSRTIGFVDANFHVVDGADRRDNCQKLNMVSFTYTSGVYLYGAAVMANYTDGNKTWTDRVLGFVESQKQYFGPADNATNVLYEPACELIGTCNVDMKSHKGQLARFMWASTLMVPAIAKPVADLLNPSAEAAAKSCTGGDKGTLCGFRWYVGGFDGDTGLGPEMCALETIQGALAATAAPPLRGAAIKDVRKPMAADGAAAPPPSNGQPPASRRRSARAFAA